MLLGRVMGTVVSTRKDDKLQGVKLLALEVVGVNGQPNGSYVVAADAVGAGVGEVVLYASGSSARQTSVTKDRPCDAVIMGIVDTWDVDGATVYTKE